jgi:membrane protein DedA with SNARE-associated domain
MAIDILALFNSTGILQFLQIHGYWIMFLLMFIEGPIVTYIAAFAASMRIFNIYYVLILSILGNTLPDLIYFLIGRLGKHEKIRKYLSRFFNETRIKRIREHLRDNPWKTITVIKITPALPFPGFILSGTTELKLSKFLLCSFIVSAVYSIFFSILGFYSGLAFSTIAKYISYGGFLMGIAILALVVIWLLYRFFSKEVSEKIEKV